MDYFQEAREWAGLLMPLLVLVIGWWLNRAIKGVHTDINSRMDQMLIQEHAAGVSQEKEKVAKKKKRAKS